jgi:hypothetical protein
MEGEWDGITCQLDIRERSLFKCWGKGGISTQILEYAIDGGVKPLCLLLERGGPKNLMTQQNNKLLYYVIFSKVF